MERIMNEMVTMKGKRCYLYGNPAAETCLIQAIDVHDLEGMERETGQIDELTGEKPYFLAAFLIDDWNQELAPWEAPPVFGTEAFGNGAAGTLAYVTEQLIPALTAQYGQVQNTKRQYMIGGYSLAGLFALWAAYRTDFFSGVAAVSPSVWYPGFKDYMSANEIQTKKVYLSLGDKEEKARNPVMSKVGDAIRAGYECLQRTDEVTSILEWNPGNHFRDSDLRTAKGFAWLLLQDQK